MADVGWTYDVSGVISLIDGICFPLRGASLALTPVLPCPEVLSTWVRPPTRTSAGGDLNHGLANGGSSARSSADSIRLRGPRLCRI